MNQLDELARKLEEQHKDIKNLILSIRKSIYSHSRLLPTKHQPKDIIESRFTLAEKAFEKGFTSCGAMANISAKILEHLGYKVKLVHGESKQSVDHAWISVYSPTENMWKEFDLTQEDTSIPPTHIKKGEVDSWEDIRSQIENDHKTIVERRKKRGST